MTKLYIVGAGGFGRELLGWIKDINRAKPTWEIIGFLDDNPHALDGYPCDYSIVGDIRTWEPRENEEFALAIGTPALKRNVVDILGKKGARFATIIHPTAMISEFARHGKGLVMLPFARIAANSVLGDYVTLLSTAIGHDTVIGDYSVISGNCSILRNVVIGSDVFIAAGVCIAQDIHIEDGAFLGLGSVVVQNVPSGANVFGNPARMMPKIK